MKKHVLLLSGILLISCVVIAQDEVGESKEVVDTTSINAFRTDHQWMSSLSYQEVQEAAQSLFKEGKRVDRDHLERTFSLSIWSSGEDGEGISEFNLFNGSNGIIGQQVTLFLDENDVVIKVAIVGWGR
jgi:hypothetical protein